jgi:hypothetical protein
MLDMETVLLVTLAYIIGIVSVMIFNRVKPSFGAHQAQVEYVGRMKEYEDMLVDLRIRLDTLEIRTGETSQPVSQHVGDASHNINIKPATIRRTLEQEGAGMVDYVLKLLVEGPKTSRQIEGLIGRSREHTARLMKKLFEMGYVTRDMATKPYTYAITDVGKTTIQQVSVSASV